MVTATPTSGRTGFLTWYEIAEPIVYHNIPIYGWSSSLKQECPTYRTSNSDGVPVRSKGVYDETIVIRGVSPYPTSFFAALNDIFLPSIRVDLGWYDNTLSKKIFRENIGLMLTELKYDFNYVCNGFPSYLWTGTFKQILPIGYLEEDDTVNYMDEINEPECFQPICFKQILTSDTLLNSGVVEHVRNATITVTYSPPLYRLANTQMFQTEIAGVVDNRITMIVEGDFEYWLNTPIVLNSRSDYKFYYDSSSYYEFLNMRITGVDNLNVDIQTGEIISATVTLEAAYG